MLKLEKAHPDHAYTLAPRLCLNDQRWIDAAYENGSSKRQEAVRDSIEDSDHALTICDGAGRMVGILGHGCHDRPTGHGFVWLMSTDELFEEHLPELTRRFRREILPALDKVYTSITCTVLADNYGLVRWLVRSGFHSVARSDRTGTPFRLMSRGL